jgi:hypothetical protein
LIGEEKRHPLRAARLRVVVNLAFLAGPPQALVDARLGTKEVRRHVETSEGRAKVREGPVRQRRARHGRKPLIADRIFAGERRERRKPLRLEASHHRRASRHSGLLLVALHEAAHRRGPREHAVERRAVHLKIDVVEIVPGVRRKLPLIDRVVGELDRIADRIRIREVTWRHAPNVRKFVLEQANHVIE